MDTNRNAESKLKYPMGATRFANARLDLQFHQIQSAFNNHLLDPHVQYQQVANLKIADVCCGTGIWLLSLLRSGTLHPSTQLYALDIDLSNLPPKPWIPKITQRVYDVFETPPAELCGVFDIVNVSLTLTFVDNDHVNHVLSNIAQLLKPGGWLQWTEMDNDGREVISPESNMPEDAIQKVLRVPPSAWELFGKPFPIWISQLDKSFASVNGQAFENIVMIKPAVDLSALRAWTEQFFVMAARDEVPDSLANRLPDTHENRKKLQKYRDIVEEAYHEILKYRAAIWIPLVRVIGKKPHSLAVKDDDQALGSVFVISSAL